MPMLRRLPLAAVVFLLCLFGAPLTFASAVVNGVHPAVPRATGPFKFGPADSPGGGIAFTPTGNLVLVWDVSQFKIEVCTMKVGARKCGNITYLTPPHHLGNLDTPQVFVPSAGHVVVLQETCCDAAVAGDDLLYTSTDGGKAFSAPARVGSLAVNAAALVGSHIVFMAAEHKPTQAESVSVNSPAAPASIATVLAKSAGDVAVGSYKGGALVASDGVSTTATYVEYAAKGKNFNASSSYRPVASFANETLIAMSGDALLTMQAKHNNTLVVRIFNGKSFGTAHAVPHTSGGGAEWFTIAQAPDGRVHVFSERGAYKLYDLIEESLSGSTWSKGVNLGSAIRNNYLDAAVNNGGKGLVLGTDPAWGYPVG